MQIITVSGPYRGMGGFLLVLENTTQKEVKRFPTPREV